MPPWVWNRDGGADGPPRLRALLLARSRLRAQGGQCHGSAVPDREARARPLGAKTCYNHPTDRILKPFREPREVLSCTLLSAGGPVKAQAQARGSRTAREERERAQRQDCEAQRWGGEMGARAVHDRRRLPGHALIGPDVGVRLADEVPVRHRLGSIVPGRQPSAVSETKTG